MPVIKDDDAITKHPNSASRRFCFQKSSFGGSWVGHGETFYRIVGAAKRQLMAIMLARAKKRLRFGVFDRN